MITTTVFLITFIQLIGEIEPDIRVIRNDEMTVEEIKSLEPDHIILSPGPGRPEDAGVIMEVAKTLGTKIPVLGVCLGHQAICAAFGATVTYAKELMHGKQSDVKFDTDPSAVCRVSTKCSGCKVSFTCSRPGHHTGRA